MESLSPIVIPSSYNYCGVFLTFACQLKCWYCINQESGRRPNYKTMSGKEWVEALNRIETRKDLPITLQGGEPTMHPDFLYICKGVRKDLNMDLLTNCQFDVEEFLHHLPQSRFKRDAPYASIRVSYHPPTMELEDTIMRVQRLQEQGYSIGVWIVNNPNDKLIPYYKQCFTTAGIDCRLKEYLDGKTYGTYKYQDIQGAKGVVCRPSELLVAPNGDIHRCHGDLYGNKKPYASIKDNVVKLIEGYAPCAKVACNSCDIKVKYDRFQVPGHCAVTIKEKNEVQGL